jgi:acyl-coenzyme A thioesterase PaaI-like protein
VREADGEPRHIIEELGFAFAPAGDALGSTFAVTPETWAPGTEQLRTSVLATWVDVVAGHLVLDVVAPVVPVTLELDVHLYRPAPGDGRLHAVARVVKAGRSVVVVAVEVADDAGSPVATGGASFMTPDPDRHLPPEHRRALDRRATGRLTAPFAERAGCVRRAPGVAALDRSEDGLNSSNTINGGLVALAVEEAVLSLSPGTALASLALRYLRPARVGPVVATATANDGLARVEVRDAGADDRVTVLATTRTWLATR